MAITRTEMDSTARERLLDTALAALAEDGREALDGARLAARAGVAEAALEAEFADLDACLDAAYEQFVDRLGDAVRNGCERGRARAARSPGEAWSAGVRGGLEALLVEVAASPARAVALIRTYPALGASRRRRYEAFVAGLPPLLAKGRQLAAASGAALPDEVELLAVGAAEAIVFEAVESGQAAALAEMAPAILFSLLVPFIGANAAAAEMEKVGGGP
jgi:AcrR family transcriptional regulator